MRKLNRVEIRILTYLDQHLDDVQNRNEAFRILKNDYLVPINLIINIRIF